MAKTTTGRSASSTANLGFQPAIGKLVDDAMVAIERDNARLKDYARPSLDKHRLGELINVIAFYRTVRPFDLMRAANDRETRFFAILRDMLLSKLLSGELQPTSTP